MQLKEIYKKIDLYFTSNNEDVNLLKFIASLNLLKDNLILDVGCGYGHNIFLLKEKYGDKVNIEGVEINEHIVNENRKKGLKCYTINEFKKNEKKYDCIIFSHVIEHFSPEDLKEFLDFYLFFLKKDGYVIIATPVLWKGFYWDFDHIKMYHPIGINQIFGRENAQIQYYGENHLELVDLWFEKYPHMIHYKKGLYIKNSFSKFYLLINLFYKILFKFSFGMFGKTISWMGLYRKR